MTTTNLNSIRGLNPCCNGIYLIMANIRIDGMSWCLNPCCNGIYLIILGLGFAFANGLVLILVVMEYT